MEESERERERFREDYYPICSKLGSDLRGAVSCPCMSV
jgi:hypothetical protein